MNVRIDRGRHTTRAVSREDDPPVEQQATATEVTPPVELEAATTSQPKSGARDRAGHAAMLLSPAGQRALAATRAPTTVSEAAATDTGAAAEPDGLTRLKAKGTALLDETKQLAEAAQRARKLAERMEGNNRYLATGYARDAYKLETALKQRVTSMENVLASDNPEAIAGQYLRTQKLARQAAGRLERMQSDLVDDANELKDALAPIRTFRETFDKVLRAPKDLLDAVGVTGAKKGRTATLVKGANALNRMATLTKAPGMLVAAGGDLKTMAESLGSMGEQTHRASLAIREGVRTIERARKDPARRAALEAVWQQTVGKVVVGDPQEALRKTQLGAVVFGRGDAVTRVGKFLEGFDGDAERAVREVTDAVSSTLRLDRLPDLERLGGLWQAVARGNRSDVREQLRGLGVDGAAADALLTRQGMNDLRALRRSVTDVVDAGRTIGGNVAVLRHAVGQAGLAWRGELAPQADVDAVEADRTSRK